jgi:glycosyltransferase involved in cell wall biosynthesis
MSNKEANLTVIIIAQNEETNISFCIESAMSWAKDVFVVDSFSTDRTQELALNLGAKVYQNRFIDWASQRNWALTHLPLTTSWILFLDADEVATTAFKHEIDLALADEQTPLAAFYVYFDFVFLGRVLKYAYESPPVLRLIKKGKAQWEGAGAREYCVVDGQIGHINNRILHNDRKGLSVWIEKQNKNATREALVLLQPRSTTAAGAGLARKSSERPFRIWLRDRVWTKLPLFIRPFFYFLYRYVVRRGFLDGKAGLAYTFLQGLWFNFLVDAKYYESLQASPTKTFSISKNSMQDEIQA